MTSSPVWWRHQLQIFSMSSFYGKEHSLKVSWSQHIWINSHSHLVLKISIDQTAWDMSATFYIHTTSRRETFRETQGEPTLGDQGCWACEMNVWLLEICIDYVRSELHSEQNQENSRRNWAEQRFIENNLQSLTLSTEPKERIAIQKRLGKRLKFAKLMKKWARELLGQGYNVLFWECWFRSSH